MTSLRMDDSECGRLLFPEMKSACLVPIVFGHETLGMISVGEARNWERQPYDADKINLLQALANEVAVVINNSQLHQTTQWQVDRMAVLNEVGRAISSTIELDGLLELIYRQLSRVIRTDTYYVGLFDPADDSLDLAVIFDEDRRFPARKIPLGDGLMTIVIRERRPVLVRNLAAGARPRWGSSPWWSARRSSPNRGLACRSSPATSCSGRWPLPATNPRPLTRRTWRC